MVTEPILNSSISSVPQLDLPEGVPPLRSLYIYAAGSCNLACRHCWIVPKFQPDGIGGPYVKIEYVEKAIREGKPLGLQVVKLTGGEPLLHPQIRQIITLIDKSQLRITIETNGTLIDASMAEFLQARSEVRFISVSLDGIDAEMHDFLRSVPGSFERAVAGVKNLVKVGYHPQVICTLHKGNAAHMAAIVKFAEELGCGSVKFNIVQQVGRGEKFSVDNGLTVEEVIQLYSQVEREIAPKSRLEIYFDVPIAFYSIGKLLKDYLGRCSVQNILGMLANGELALCGIGITVPDLTYGRIDVDNLRDVWCTNPGLSLLRKQIPFELEGICSECLHRNMCQGQCVASNYHTTGKLKAPYYFCEQAEALGLFPQDRKRTL